MVDPNGRRIALDMKAPVAGLLCALTIWFGVTWAMAGSGPPKSVDAYVHHHVSTPSTAAQAAFDRGLLDYYAYNPESAEHEFYTAADLDTHLAMAYWGIAMSNASNLNITATDDRDGQAVSAIRQAQSLERYATPEERAYIDAAATRFSDDPKVAHSALLLKYRDAMRRMVIAYPDDPDVAALFGEAAVYVATAGVANSKENLSVAQKAAYVARVSHLLPYFEAKVAKFPKHVGLLHFFIHAADEANSQQIAIAASRQLGDFTFPDQDSHLTHMPGHIFFKVGLYEEALEVARRSVAMDYANLNCCHPGYYGATRYYHYHNIEFLLYAMTETAHLRDAVAIGRREADNVLIARQLVAGQRWRDVLAIPYQRGQSNTVAFARGLAYAQLGDKRSAESALKEMPKAPSDSPSWAATVTAMKLTLQAKLAEMSKDNAKALLLLTKASGYADKGDSLSVAEFPAMYYYSPHLALAELARRLGKVEVARKAFQDELTMNPRSPAALRGLAQLITQP